VKGKLDQFAKVAFFVFPLFFVCGLVMFPDMPISPCGEGSYCGKQYQPRTREDYEWYRWWSLISPALLALSFLSIAYIERKRLRRSFGRK
jgi:hypothetical protein